MILQHQLCTFSELTAICGDLIINQYCNQNEVATHLTEATNLESCPSECDIARKGAIGCCEWQHDWGKCMWYTDDRIWYDPNNYGRSAVSCQSKCLMEKMPTIAPIIRYLNEISRLSFVYF